MNKLVLLVFAFNAISCHMGLLRDFGVNNKHFLGKNHHSQGLHKFISQMQEMEKVISVQMDSELIVVEHTIEVATNKYDECLDELEVISHNIVLMARTCLDGKWQETIPIAQKTFGLLVHDLKCFKEAHDKSSVQNFGIDPTCAIDHLNQAAGQLKLVFNDIISQNWKLIQPHFEEMIAIFKDIQNC